MKDNIDKLEEDLLLIVEKEKLEKNKEIDQNVTLKKLVNEHK